MAGLKSSATPSSFNPRPAVRPGATTATRVWVGMTTRFNPRPAVRPGATQAVLRVSPIQGGVSILARRLGRGANRADGGRYFATVIPLLYVIVVRPGATVPMGAVTLTLTEVSILARRLGRVQHTCITCARSSFGVSILARRLGRVQLVDNLRNYITSKKFQSSPGG